MGELTPERLAELRRVAEAATPGPWEVSGPDSGSGDMQHATEVFAQDEYGTELDICLAPSERDPEAESADLEYIARFDPTTALSLLDEIERLRRVLKEIEWRGHDPNENGDVCPWCGWEKRDGHRPDCELAAALVSAPAAPPAERPERVFGEEGRE